MSAPCLTRPLAQAITRRLQGRPLPSTGREMKVKYDLGGMGPLLVGRRRHIGRRFYVLRAWLESHIRSTFIKLLPRGSTITSVLKLDP